MSKPFGGQYLDEIEGELMFGELPDEDLSQGGDDETEIDANNDETFGAEINPGNADELEDYAAQTACLRLDDGWDKPGSNVDAPDASQLPIPDFEMDVFRPADLSFGKLDGIWNPSPLLDSIWESTSLHKDKFSSPLTPSVISSSDFSMDSSAWNFNRTNLHGLPNLGFAGFNVRTAEDIERELLNQTTSSTTSAPMPPAAPAPPVPVEMMIPSIPASALSAEELERNFLRESAQKEAKMQSQIPPHGIPTQNAPMPNQFPAQFNLPGVHPPFQPAMAPFMPSQNMNYQALQAFPPLPPEFRKFVPAWVDQLLGRPPKYPPQSIPPMHPFILMKLQQLKDPRIVASMLMRSAGIAPRNDMNMNMNMSMNMAPQSHPPSRQGFHRKAPGMPSDKTIEDLALDKFAGFMSWKERQWLERIQSLQCQGNGNQYEEDYYYICWRQKRSQQVNQQVNKVENGKNHRREHKEPVPLTVKFAGSLGLPSKCTTSNPRHLINVNIHDGNEDENDENKPQSGAQKKLRTLLLRLESALSLVIECSDRRIAMQHPSQQKDILVQEINERVDSIIKDLFQEDLPKLLQVNKGRLLIRRVMMVSSFHDFSRILNTILKIRGSLPDKYYAEIRKDLLSTLYSCLSHLSREELTHLFASLDMKSIKAGLEEKNNLSCEFFITFLAVASQKKLSASSSFFVWLRGPSKNFECTIEDWKPIIKNLQRSCITRDEIVLLSEWLKFLVSDLPSTVASQLASTISKCIE